MWSVLVATSLLSVECVSLTRFPGGVRKRGLSLRNWCRNLLDDLSMEGRQVENLSDIRVGLRYLAEEVYPFWMVVPYMMALPASDINELLWDKGHFYYTVESDIAKKIMNAQCQTSGVQSPVVIDVGANTGYFSLLAASSGCRAIAVEPYKLHTDFLALSVSLNGFEPLVHIVPKIATNEEEVSFDGWSASATTSTERLEMSKMKSQDVRKQVTSYDGQRLVKLDDLIKEDVLYLKVDVEGHEPNVLASASKLFHQHVVKYVLFEMTYYLNGWKDEEYLRVLEGLLDQQYKLFHIETVRPLQEPHKTLPVAKVGISQWMENIKSSECDTANRHFCQLNIFAVHPGAMWPL
uniref:Methyltransferase FkbM domain-containing protein n=1 Tax=Picocystis salinarum TaxID=88271 RepID=A0A7S3UEI5_9CHLO|mmetsp:Transcript_5716/g.19989  ORF Transcript_5716/g.19989 Transcript_5716/m.19989 type:complete len:350 (-) Transcript_5716:1803-2852(-)